MGNSGRSEPLNAALAKATADLSSEIDAAAKVYGYSVCDGGGGAVDVRLTQLRDRLAALCSPVQCRLRPRRDLNLQPRAEEGGVDLVFSGAPHNVYITLNQCIRHRDARCISADESCAFSLVRALIGFEVSLSPAAAKAFQGSRCQPELEEDSRLLHQSCGDTGLEGSADAAASHVGEAAGERKERMNVLCKVSSQQSVRNITADYLLLNAHSSLLAPREKPWIYQCLCTMTCH